MSPLECPFLCNLLVVRLMLILLCPLLGNSTWQIYHGMKAGFSFLGSMFESMLYCSLGNSFKKVLTRRQNLLLPLIDLLEKQKPTWASKNQSWA